MNSQDEHDDDLEPEVNESGEFEREEYEVEDDEDGAPQRDITDRPGATGGGATPSDTDEEESEGEASDTI